MTKYSDKILLKASSISLAFVAFKRNSQSFGEIANILVASFRIGDVGILVSL